MAIYPTNRKTIGTCSECGGPVQTPGIWGAITPPPVECARCGARPKRSHGPVIEMERPPKRYVWRSVSAGDYAVRADDSRAAFEARLAANICHAKTDPERDHAYNQVAWALACTALSSEGAERLYRLIGV